MGTKMRLISGEKVANPTPKKPINLKLIDPNGKVVTTLIDEQIKASPEATSIKETIGGVRSLCFIMIPVMIGFTIFEYHTRDNMSVLEYINRFLAIYISTGATISLNDSYRNKPYSPTTIFLWPKRPFNFLKRLINNDSK
ncbi:hypothetical protein DZF79_03120 [Vibrio parahaemolyticus]|nr:hypothetical protein [Vibrio parahaemolyticus]